MVLAGRPGEQALAAVGRSLNVVLVRPEEPPSGTGPGPAEAGGGELAAAAAALRRASGISASYVLVTADPLGAVAAAWREMWTISARARGTDEFELRAAQALAAWRAKQFELPDYYLVLADTAAAGGDAPPSPDGGGVTVPPASLVTVPWPPSAPGDVTPASSSSPEGVSPPPSVRPDGPEPPSFGAEAVEGVAPHAGANAAIAVRARR